MRNDGPWTLDENLKRHNGVLTYSGGTQAQGWNLTGMGYDANWRSTDQIPQRLIDAGSFNGQPFGRFDAIDGSDGGDTSRVSLSGEWHRNVDGQLTRVLAYAMRYRLELYSNFTYWTPADGDQFLQRDRRKRSGCAPAMPSSTRSARSMRAASSALQLRRDRIRGRPLRLRRPGHRGTTRDDTSARRWPASTARPRGS